MFGYRQMRRGDGGEFAGARRRCGAKKRAARASRDAREPREPRDPREEHESSDDCDSNRRRTSRRYALLVRFAADIPA
jgi:hypothetical protein